MLPVYNHMLYAFAQLVRVAVVGSINYGVGVEDNNVCSIVHGNQSAVFEAYP